MRKFFLGLVILNTVTVYAGEADCRTQVRDLRREITESERQNVEVISFLTSVGEYLVGSGRSLKVALQSGSRISVAAGDTLIYNGHEVIKSAGNASSNNTIQNNRLLEKLDALEDCML